MPRLAALCLALLAALGLAATEAPPADPAPSIPTGPRALAVIHDHGKTTTDHNPEPKARFQTSQPLSNGTVRKQIQIEGLPEKASHRTRMCRVTPDGHHVTALPAVNEVRVYDADGKHVHTVTCPAATS